MISTAPLKVSGETSHRDKLFINKCKFVRENILDYIGKGWELAMIPCSGTGAIEAMVSNVKCEKGVVLSNGAYGERLNDIVQHYYDTGFIHDYDDLPIDIIFPSDFEGYTRNGKAWCFMVHGETSNGYLNSINLVLDSAEKNKMMVALDAVATFGIDDIPFEHPNLGAVAFSSNKGLACNPGIGFVAYRQGYIRKNDTPAYYFDLGHWNTEKLAFTPAVSIIEELFDVFSKNSNYINTMKSYIHIMNGYLRDFLNSVFNGDIVNDESWMNCLIVVNLGNKKNDFIKHCRDNGIEIYSGSGNTVKISALNFIEDKKINSLSKYNYFKKIVMGW